jgi:hypothetical protein
MKYTQEITKRITEEYQAGKSVAEISAGLLLDGFAKEPVPERSLIAKLSSVGVYKKKEYLTKRGEIPIKKEEYIERIAALLDVNAETLESLEKVNKAVLALLEKRLSHEETS